MTSRKWRESEKRYLRERCSELGITVAENATKRQLEVALDEYNKDAVLVHTEKGVEYRHTDKPSAAYTVEFTIRGYHTVRAESEQAAIEWIEDRCELNYVPGKYEDAEITEWEIGDVYKDGEDNLCTFEELCRVRLQGAAESVMQ